MTDTTPLRVWFFANFEETADTASAYTTLEAAQRAAVTDYEAGDTGPGTSSVAYEWRTSDEQPDHFALFEDGAFSGYWVQPLEVVGDRFEAEYGAYAMDEGYARNEVREELECGQQASGAMAFWPHNHYEPWHIVAVTDEATAGLHLDVKHPKDCDPDGEYCSAAYHVKHFGLDGERGTPTAGTYRVRYWWDNYEPDGDGLEVETCAPNDYHPDCGRRVADCDCRTVAVLADVQAERLRQIAKWGVQHREDGTDLFTYPSIAVRSRENFQNAEARGTATWPQTLNGSFYEAISTADVAALRATLIELAAVACAWVEDIDSRTAGAR